MCTYPVQPVCTSVFILIFIKTTVYCIAHLISLHIFLFSVLFSPIFIYILLFICVFFCTVHWADLSWLTFHYWLYPVWLCMWRIIKNLEEPWTLNLCSYRKQVFSIVMYQCFWCLGEQYRSRTRYCMPPPSSLKCLQFCGKRDSRTLMRLWYQVGLMFRKQS